MKCLNHGGDASASHKHADRLCLERELLFDVEWGVFELQHVANLHCRHVCGQPLARIGFHLDGWFVVVITGSWIAGFCSVGLGFEELSTHHEFKFADHRIGRDGCVRTDDGFPVLVLPSFGKNARARGQA